MSIRLIMWSAQWIATCNLQVGLALWLGSLCRSYRQIVENFRLIATTVSRRRCSRIGLLLSDGGGDLVWQAGGHGHLNIWSKKVIKMFRAWFVHLLVFLQNLGNPMLCFPPSLLMVGSCSPSNTPDCRPCYQIRIKVYQHWQRFGLNLCSGEPEINLICNPKPSDYCCIYD